MTLLTSVHSAQIRQNEKGFTLVELAIVMIIIGLLITGVLKGQEMIANARVTSTIAAIKSLEAANNTFLDAYDALPGDITTPGTRLPNCANNCADAGNGDGRVAAGDGSGAFAAADILGADVVGAGAEARAFFTHLAAADLITGVSTDPSDANAEAWGEAAPSMSMGSGGILVGYTADGTATGLIGGAMRSGTYLSIRPSFDAVPTGQGLGALTPTQAGRIDRKLDEGSPDSGIVRAAGYNNAAGCADSTATPPVYLEGQPGNECSLYIRIQ